MKGEIKANRSLTMTLSNSSISTFRQCPRKFYYEYVLRLPRKQKDYFQLGTFVHYVLEVFYTSLMKDRTQKLGPLMGECFKQARDKYSDTSAVILADAKTLLQDYLSRVISRHKLPNDMAMENKFNIEVDGIKLTGVIDRIDFGEDGHIDIVDYKTGKKAKSKNDFEEDLQLPLYTIAVMQLYQAPVEKITCKLDHIKVKAEQKLDPTEETIRKATETIVKSYESIQDRFDRMETEKWSEIGPKTVEKIKEFSEWSKELEKDYLIFITRYSKHWEPKVGWYCNYCDFYRICQNALW